MTPTRAPRLVSVIMPVYCGEQFIAAAIESVLAQTYQSFELVIVNDGTPDESAGEIGRFLPHPQIRYVEQENAGVANARNRGIEYASGAFIALLDQDDLWLPQKLEREIAYLDTHPEVGFVHSRVDCIDGVGAPCSCDGAIWVYPFEGFCAGRLLLGNGVAGVTVLMRAKCIDEVGRFDQRFAPGDDWELWMRIARRYPVGFLDEVTARYRVHSENVSKDQLKMQRAVLKIIDAICECFPDIPENVGAGHVAVARSRALSGAAAALEASGMRAEARKYWWEAFKTNGDINAALAMIGMRAPQRRKAIGFVDARPWLRRRVTWYAYKASTTFATDSRRRERTR